MYAQLSILIYGRDHGLMDTRRWVLELAGYRVFTAQSLVEAGKIATLEPISLLLLCHTLSVEDCQMALELADSVRPGMKRLLMTASKPRGLQESHDRILSAFDGPRALIAAVRELLASSMNSLLQPSSASL